MQEEYQMSNMDIKAHINNLRKNPKFTEEILKLVESDLQYGLSIDDVEEYLSKKFDYTQMKVYSICLRNRYPKEIRECITKENLTGEQMSVVLEFYEKGVSIETITEVIANNGQSALMMKQSFQNILEKMKKVEDTPKDTYAEQLFQQIKCLVEKIEFQGQCYDVLDEKLKELQISKLNAEKEQQFLEQLAEKDHLLEQQQNDLNNARVTIIKLKNEKEQMEKHILEMQREVNANSNCIMREGQLQEIQVNEKNQIIKKQGVFTKLKTCWDGCKETVIDKNGVIPTVKKEHKPKKLFISACFSKAIHKKKLNIIKLVTEKNLKPNQIVQIRNAIEKGLREDQILTLINSQVSAEQMEEIIRIAIYENTLESE